MYKIVYEDKAYKDFDDIPKNDCERIFRCIDDLGKQPFPAGCKKLNGPDKFLRIRKGNYRVVYKVDEENKIIRIVRVRHRKDVYRGLN